MTDEELMEQEFENLHNQRKLNVHLSADNYIDAKDYEYQLSMERINLDEEKATDVNTRG